MNLIKNINSIAAYRDRFNEPDFWKKISDTASRAGRSLVAMALTLYYGLESASFKNKILILGALGYFIFPADAIPDFIPLTGYADDLAALTAIYNIIKDSLDASASMRANAKLEEWFPATVN